MAPIIAVSSERMRGEASPLHTYGNPYTFPACHSSLRRKTPRQEGHVLRRPGLHGRRGPGRLEALRRPGSPRRRSGDAQAAGKRSHRAPTRAGGIGSAPVGPGHPACDLTGVTT
ncbi:hypothetical protein BEI_2257 [Halomonas beimenensis]|uniref:Uncharacterized protein n=1 Tax=Halomonas beimenensis TaxID=475662 RepID=A0A291P8N3_9GAMM|nr:hypothetical protein BEI_2257 [Halomonas beimenensis]